MADCATCVPCPAMEAMRPCLVSSLAAKPGVEHPGYQDRLPGRDVQRRCHCRVCCCGKPPEVSFCYEQPKSPESFAPKRCWSKPTVPVDSTTTYKSSYVAPEDCMIRTEIIGNKPALGPGTGPMSENTTYRLSYLPDPVCQVKPIRPCHRPMFGSGPMDCLTNYRKEYIPKPMGRPESFKPGKDNLTIVGKPFETRTMSRLTYLDPGPAVIPQSWAPKKCWVKPDEKMDCDTTNRLSYLPICVFPPETPPWANKSPYKTPTKKMETTTVKQLSYLPPGKDCSSIKEQCVYGPCLPCECKSPARCIKSSPCVCAMAPDAKAACYR